MLGHVDHGKTTLLDAIRGTTVAAREAGGITQHIGATEVPLDAILKMCGELRAGKTFKVPGLLFIDTPGHVAFTTLRARGGALADLAVLVVDINEGFRPQTVESLNILRRFKTPFVVAANKIDRIPGWRKNKGMPFILSQKEQGQQALDELDRMLYELVGKFFENGFTAERYDKVQDFATNVAIVPLSAKFSEGVADLLLTLVGLAQKFLEAELKTEAGPGEGAILEVKEEKGLGLTLDAIIYKGTVRRGDVVVLGTHDKPRVTKVRTLLRPKPLDEIRDPQDRFDPVRSVSAAAGVKISAADLEGVISGAPLRVVSGDEASVVEEVARETEIKVETVGEGLLIKADAIGSLEALAFECKQSNIPVKMARIGAVSRRDVVDAATVQDPLHRVVMAFNTPILEDAKAELAKTHDVEVISNDVIYRLLEDYVAWTDRRKRELAEEKRRQITHPGKLLVLPEFIFRTSKPAIVGVRVLAGRVRPGQSLIREDGRPSGKVRSLRSGETPLQEAITGKEVATAIEGVTVGRQIKGGDVLYVDLTEADARALRDAELTHDERETLEKVCEIKRKTDPFWGM